MTGSIAVLAVTVVLFVTSHLVLAYPPVRTPLVMRLGERAFRGVYSVLSLALLVWVGLAYRDAPIIDVWYPPTGLKHLSLLIMPLAFVLLAAGLTTANPSVIGGDRSTTLTDDPAGVVKVTRHPVMWAIALWGIAHLLANGDVSSIVLFGAMIILALLGARMQDSKKRLQLGPRWDAFAARTSFIPFAALFAGRSRLRFGEIGWWRLALGLVLFALLLWLHPWLFGGNPLPV
jgi:uncharacterized membrane protein